MEGIISYYMYFMFPSLCRDFGKARIHCSLVSVIIEMSLYTGVT